MRVETSDTERPSMPDGIVAVCLLHLGIGALAVLSSLLLLVLAPLVGVFTLFLGLVLLALGYGLMNLRAREWRGTIALHGIDILVSLLLIDGLRRIVSPIISAAIIVYLYSRRDLFFDDSDGDFQS